MEIIIHELDGEKVAEVVSDAIVIGNVQEALDLMVDPGLKGARKIIIHKENIVPGFFDLSTRIAGEILQKFVTYQVKLAIVGDFSNASETLKSFIYESNRGNQIFFLGDVESAKKRLFGAK
jgi:hypothetical protein